MNAISDTGNLNEISNTSHLNDISDTAHLNAISHTAHLNAISDTGHLNTISDTTHLNEISDSTIFVTFNVSRYKDSIDYHPMCSLRHTQLATFGTNGPTGADVPLNFKQTNFSYNFLTTYNLP